MFSGCSATRLESSHRQKPALAMRRLRTEDLSTMVRTGDKYKLVGWVHGTGSVFNIYIYIFIILYINWCNSKNSSLSDKKKSDSPQSNEGLLSRGKTPWNCTSPIPHPTRSVYSTHRLPVHAAAEKLPGRWQRPPRASARAGNVTGRSSRTNRATCPARV